MKKGLSRLTGGSGHTGRFQMKACGRFQMFVQSRFWRERISELPDIEKFQRVLKACRFRRAFKLSKGFQSNLPFERFWRVGAVSDYGYGWPCSVENV